MSKAFPKPESFELYDCDIPASNGVMDNIYGVISLPKEVVKQMLPAGMELAEQALTDTGTHPVFMFFTHNKFGQPSDELLIHYRELLVGIPLVKTSRRINDYEGTYTYMPRLYINQDEPRVWGNKQFGYEKLAADIEDDGHGQINVRTVVDGCLVAAALASIAGQTVAPGDIEALSMHRELFHSPLLTQAARRSDPDSASRSAEEEFLVSWIKYDFDHPTARVTPLELKVEIGHLFTPRVFPLGTYEIPSIAAHKLGAFRLQVRQHVFGQVEAAGFSGIPE